MKQSNFFSLDKANRTRQRNTALGLKCRSGCAACWLDNNANGVDIKISCPNDQCGDTCPSGYNGIHCAKYARCNCRPGHGSPCDELGPCQCGIEVSAGGYHFCKAADANRVCPPS